ncbi:hypothetical protein LPN04_24085 [Rugamonas sp. A1-17]|nr:hypothetical protein [Rugamonas sp. A1-17]
MITPTRRVLGCCALLAMAGAPAATITIQCPDKFPAEAIHFSAAPTGWTPYAPNALEARTAELMYGPPSSYTYAAPTTFHEGKRRDVGVWGASATGENWLQCGYGAGRELTLSQRLPPVTDCTITMHKDTQGNVVKVSASCRLAAAGPNR